MIAAAGMALVCAGLLGTAILVHTRLRGFLPEDPPGLGRKRHPRPTPMAGTIPATLTVAVLLASGAPWLAAGVGIAAAVGLVDDLRKNAGTGLAWTTKAAALLGATACAALSVAGHAAADGPLWWLAVGLFVFALTNATNFLDNQDGVATGLGVVALAVVGAGDLQAPATLLAAAWVAFLPFNWPRARLFLGDGGALPLGLCVAAFALRGAVDADGHLSPLRALAPVAVLALDFVQVITARLVLGYAPWIGDRRHLTHVILTRGVPRVALAPLLWGLALAAALLIP